MLLCYLLAYTEVLLKCWSIVCRFYCVSFSINQSIKFICKTHWSML